MRHYENQCPALRYYRCSAPGCESTQRFKSFEDIRDKHWKKDCQMCFRQCPVCKSIYKNNKHNCVTILIEQLQSLKTENAMYEQDEETLKREIARGQNEVVLDTPFAQNIEQFYDRYWTRMNSEQRKNTEDGLREYIEPSLWRWLINVFARIKLLLFPLSTRFQPTSISLRIYQT